jgi:hypothetical protein
MDFLRGCRSKKDLCTFGFALLSQDLVVMLDVRLSMEISVLKGGLPTLPSSFEIAVSAIENGYRTVWVL